MEKFTDTNHPFHMTGLSEYLVLPKHQNDVVCFHGLKNKWQYENIQNDYCNSVIDCEEILVYYQNNSIFFEKNSFLNTKKINSFQCDLGIEVILALFSKKGLTEIFNISCSTSSLHFNALAIQLNEISNVEV